MLSTTRSFFSVKVFMHDFPQKVNRFVKYCYPSIFMDVKPVGMFLILFKLYGVLYTTTPILEV